MMSLIDCATMNSNEVMVEAAGKDDHWDAWSYMLRDGEIHRAILSTNGGIFKSKKNATDWMNRVVKAVKSVSEKNIMNADEYTRVLNSVAHEFAALVDERTEAGEIS